MSYKFEIKHMEKLNSPKRRALMPPEKTLDELGLLKSDTVADIGCGIGYFSIPAAEIAKENIVYALDPSQEMLDYLAANSNSPNLKLVKTDEYDFKIEGASIDFALMANVFHEIDDKPRFMEEIKRILKDHGRLAVIEFQKKETEMGPDIAHRISPGELLKLLGKHFVIDRIIDIGDVFYGAVFLFNK